MFDHGWWLHPHLKLAVSHNLSYVFLYFHPSINTSSINLIYHFCEHDPYVKQPNKWIIHRYPACSAFHPSPAEPSPDASLEASASPRGGRVSWGKHWWLFVYNYIAMENGLYILYLYYIILHYIWLVMIWLVVYLPLWNIWKSILWWLFPIYGKIKNVPNHQPVIVCV